MTEHENINLFSIMNAFAESTGLTDPGRQPRRYLWTDAFAVCNFIEMYRQTDDPGYLQLAKQLVAQVHDVLGRTRDGSTLLSALNSHMDENEAALHPTRGGLRIGKKLDERHEHEPFDDRLEWDRDGQYFHYLTKWMHALDCLARATGNGVYNRWAIELAQTAFKAFSYTPDTGEARRMYWKMSIDLSRPLLYSMGQHDPLDGLLTFQQLQATAQLFPDTPDALTLQQEISEFSAMCAGVDWATRDPLGIGGLLSDAYRLVQLIGEYGRPEASRLESLLRDIERSMQAFLSPEQHNSLALPAEYRLAFRELGLAIGLAAIDKMQAATDRYPEKFTGSSRISSSIHSLLRHRSVYHAIRDFWLVPEHHANETWQEHRDINSVMLATCLAPDSYLTLSKSKY